LIRALAVPPGARVVVLADTAYDAKVIRAACQERGYTWVVPLNPERVLAGAKPRPKVRTLLSALEPSQFAAVRLDPRQGRYVAQRRLSPGRAGRKGKCRTFYVHAERREVQAVGLVQLVFSCQEKPQSGEPLPATKILMTNDTGLKAAAVVELYGLRWQVELFFKELKGTLGFHQYRFRDFAKVEAWVQAALVAFLYLEWIRGRRLRAGGLAEKERRWWQSQRSYGLSRAVRQGAEAQELGELARLAGTKTGIKKLRKILRQAQPPEYRTAI
jgi:hypothetical protein